VSYAGCPGYALVTMMCCDDRELRLQAALLVWGEANRRHFPWRQDRDPYRVLVAETMLTQTQASRVVSYYRNFLERFASPAELATASVQDVLASWSGLGYNRRAIRLRTCAQVLVERHHGVVPQNYHDLCALPGVGAYIANAVLAQAYGHKVSALDTNAKRVLSRAFFGPVKSPTMLQAKANAVVPLERSWEWTQAVFDLGALVCRSHPSCQVCPLKSDCTFAGEGDDPYIPPRRQSVFEGSHRQKRGLVVRALATGVSDREELRRYVGLDNHSFDLIYQELSEEGFLDVNSDHRS